MRSFILLLFLSLLQIGFSQTQLEGILDEDKTLTLAESPYTLSNYFLVQEGVTLTIEAGVTIEASGTEQILIQGGAIVAEGTEEKPITFNGISGASISIKNTNRELSKFKYVVFNSFHLFLSSSENDNKSIGALTLENITSKNNNITDNSSQGDWNNLTSLIINNSNLDNVNVNLTSDHTFLVVDNSLIENSTLNTYDFEFNNNTFKNFNFTANAIYNLRNAVNRIVSMTNNVFVDGNILISELYDKLTFNKTKLIDVNVSAEYFWDEFGQLEFSNSLVVQNKIQDMQSGFMVSAGRSGKIKLTNVNIISKDKKFASSRGNKAYVSSEFVNFESETALDRLFEFNEANDEQTLSSNTNNSNIYVNRNVKNIIYNNIKSDADFSSNYWNGIADDALSELTYDFEDDPISGLGRVYFTPTSSEPNTSAPISSPKGFVKYVDGDDLVLKWVANPESDIAGYKVHYGTHVDYVYETSIDIGNVNTYTIAQGATLENVYLTAYDNNADGAEDQLEGFESWYTEVKEIPTLSFKSEFSQIDEGENQKIELILSHASPVDVTVNLSYSGTAILDTDYTSNQSVIIPSGETVAFIDFTSIDDSEIETLKELNISIIDANDVALGNSTNHNVTMLSNDYPTLSITPDTTSFNEGDVQEFTVELSEPHSKSTVIEIDFSGSLDSDDFTATKQLDEEFDFVTFSKTWEDDPSQAIYQDRINEYVWLTRGSRQGLYNTAAGDFNDGGWSGYNSGAPSGVEFALGSFDEGVENLNFVNDLSRANDIHPKNNIGKDYVMKVVSNVETVNDETVYEYDYYSLKFSVWDQGENRTGWKITDTSVTYQRSRQPLSKNTFNIRIKAGETSTNYTLNFTDDLIYEGEESLVQAFNFTNVSTSNFSTTFTIDDFVEITTAVSSTDLNEGESTTITASLSEVRSLNTIVNFDLSGTAEGDDIKSSLGLSNNGISTLFGMNGFDDNRITEMVLHNNTVYFSVGRSGIFKINPDKSYSSVVNYSGNPQIRSFTFDQDDNLYVIEEHTVYKYLSSSNYDSNDKVAVTIEGNWGSNLNQLRDASSIILDKNNNLIIADSGNHRIVKWEQGGTEGELVFGDPNGGYSSGNNGLNNPKDIVFDGTYYYVLDNNERNRIVVLDSEFNFVSSTISFNNTTAPEQYYIESMFIENDRIYVPLGMKDWNTTFNNEQGEIIVFNTYSDGNPMEFQGFIDFKYTNESNEEVQVANERGYFIIDDNGNFYLQGDSNKIHYKQNAPKIIIPAGKLSSSINVVIVDDLSYEGDEELILNPSSPNNTIDENHVINITDNDTPPLINISFSAPFIDENQEQAVVVNFKPEISSGLEISFDIELSGTATKDSEYVISAEEVIIPAKSSGSVTISTKDLDDLDIEIAETIILNLTNLVNASFETPAVLELHSDDYPEATIVVDNTEFAEHQTLKLNISISQPHSKETVVSYKVDNNTSIAEQGKDFYFTNDGGIVKFLKPSWANHEDPEYQDRISETVWLTRGKNGGLYNAYDQQPFDREKGNYEAQHQNPTGTLWALGSIEVIDSLHFIQINEWGRKFKNEGWLGKDMVLYLTQTDEYYSFNMDSWDAGGQGGFSYTRSKASITKDLKFTIPAGQTTGYAYVSGIDDEIMDEGTEPLTVIYDSIENGTISQTENITLTILDNITTMTLREDVFVGVQNGDFSWGDFDSDGDKDLALIGDAGETLISKVYENKRDGNGNVVFEEIDFQFTGVGFGAVEWVDLNQDGKVDLFISGVDENVQVRSLVYINNSSAGNPSFDLVDTYNFPELVETSLDFGDLDNDGDVDYAITGYDSSQNLQAYYGYQNIETSNFDIKSANFDPFVNGELRIVDIDADGDNDVIYTGGNDVTGERGGVVYNSYVPSQNNNNNHWSNWWQNEQLRSKFGTLEIFKPQESNGIGYMVMGQGKGYAVNSELSIPHLKNGDIAAGDFNNNGVDDFLFTGETSTGEGYTKLFEGLVKPVMNDETATMDKYKESIFTFDPLINSSAEWVDYDNDGDLDLFMIGLKIGEGEKTYLYETEVNNKKNSKPETITALNSELVGNGVVKLSWNKPSDDFTNVLGYNVRLGKSSGGTELSYTVSNLDTGDLLVSRSPNNYNLFYQTQLEPGTYYWSVQAVDQGLKAGPYSEEQSFTIVYDWKILNQGGLFDKAITSGNDPMLKVVDIDSDEDLDVILRKDNTVEFYSYNYGILEKTVLNNFSGYLNNVKEIQFADFMNQADNSLFISSNGNLRGFVLGQTPNFHEYQNWEYNEKINNWEEATITEFPGSMRVITFQDGTRRIDCWTNDGCSVIPEKTTSIGVQNEIFIANLNLYEEKYGIADFNNDGINEIFVIGVDSDIDVFMNVKFYMFSYDKFTNSFEQIDLTEQISEIGRIKGPSFDFGDYDNDQDLDIIISGDKIVGTSVTKIFRNTTNPGEKNITLEASEEVITGVSNGSTDFIDYDSDGDLDILLSGTDDTGVDVFELLKNDQSGEWSKIQTNLEPMKNTNVDLGDFNGDGYVDMLISGETAQGKSTKLMEYTPAAGFIESEFDVSDIVDARVEFGDLDGDEDLDFVIAGKSKSNENQNIFRTYLNYRNESYKITNPPSFDDIEFMVKHENNITQVVMKEDISVASIILEFEKDVSIDIAATLLELITISPNSNPLTLLANENKVIIYGDVTKAFSRQEFTTILIHDQENIHGEIGNTIKSIKSVAAVKDGKLKSITANSKIYDPITDDLEQFSTSIFNAERLLSNSAINSSLNSEKKSQRTFITTNESSSIQSNNTNVKPDMPYLLNSTVVDGELDKALGKLFVELSWRSAVDDNTDLEGLSYAIKMGTSPGAENIVSSNSSLNGVRKAAGKGNAEHNTKWKIALEPGTYYWSVQSIDNAQTGSEFSFEDVFTVSEDNLLYDLGDSNGDDVVNIADIINVVDYMLGVNLPRFIDYATDVNDDNSINVLDLMGIVDIILSPQKDVNSLALNDSDSNNFKKIGIQSISDIEYRSSKAVGDVNFYWRNNSLYMHSEHKVGGLQLSIDNDLDVIFGDNMNALNKTKIQKENEYELLFYSMNATALEDDIKVFTLYGDIERFNANSIIVATTSGYKLNVNFETLSTDDNFDANGFVVKGVYPNPVTNNIINVEYFTPTILENQVVSVYDLVGREIIKKSMNESSTGLNRVSLDLKKLPNGVFFIEFTADSSENKSVKHISKFIKQ
jgi:hypothetical protein